MPNILIAGDYCPIERISQMVEKSDYSFFDEIRSVVQKADYSIVNFECPVVVDGVKPIEKCGPALRTTSKAVDSIKYAGFDCVTLANNHFRDFGDEGCLTTIKELEKQGIDYVGGGINLQEARRILIKEIDGKKLAVVNFCENEFSIATATTPGAAPLDAVDNYHQIMEARKVADFVLVIVHGGHEHYQLPSSRMKKLYRFFVEIGADAVVNHHQHCYSGYEFYNGKPIVYGLGNFCFDRNSKRKSIWNEGYCVSISFGENSPHIELIPYVQCDESPNVNVVNEDNRTLFDNRIEELNTIIADDVSLQSNFDNWVEKNEKYVFSLFASYHNRYLNAAATRGYIPFPISKKEIGAILNRVCCEAHRDITLSVLDKRLKD